jgi:ABC-2 type transport system ATP-binding protein
MTPAIVVVDLGKRFGSFEAVRGVSFQVEPGEIFGYLGANGAGKSTTIRILCGLMSPSRGRALVAGHDVAADPDAVRLAVGYMSQKFSLYPDLTAIENLEFFGGAYRIPYRERMKRAGQLLDEVDLTAQSRTLVKDLPGGLRQRLALATAIIHQPRIVFLDEPTAGVDPEARRTFWRLIRRLSADGTTVFVTTHYMDEAEYCARVGLMVQGRLAALDTPEALKRAWVPGRLWAVRGRRLRSESFRGQPGVDEVVPFGAGLHVRGALGEEAIVELAQRAGGLDVHVEEAEPTLEDVFLAVVGTG